MTVSDLQELLAYNEWANARIFRAATAVATTQFLRSLRDTLLHIVVEEWISLRRCRGETPVAPLPWARLEDVLNLQRALGEVERERREFFSSLTSKRLEVTVVFRSLDGVEYRHRNRDLLLLVINAKCHARWADRRMNGQACAGGRRPLTPTARRRLQLSAAANGVLKPV